MKSWKAGLWAAAVVLAVAAILGGVLAEPLLAQVRATLVKDADNGARQPFAASASTAFAAGQISAEATLLTVAAGKRAVIEHVSCINYLDAANNFVRAELKYTANSSSARHQFVHTRVGASLASGIDVWSFSQPVKAYADSSTAISVYLLRRLGAGSGGLECQISGHLVDNAL